MSHTPAPWVAVSPANDTNALDVYPDNDRHYLLHHGVWGKKADAYLIAAAPDLLDALQEMYATCLATNKAGRAAQSKARDAFRKARGE